jgi:hypothetical protein
MRALIAILAFALLAIGPASAKSAKHFAPGHTKGIYSASAYAPGHEKKRMYMHSSARGYAPGHVKK